VSCRITYYLYIIYKKNNNNNNKRKRKQKQKTKQSKRNLVLLCTHITNFIIRHFHVFFNKNIAACTRRPFLLGGARHDRSCRLLVGRWLAPPLVRPGRLFGSLELHFQPLVAHLVRVHRLYGRLRAVRVVIRHEPYIRRRQQRKKIMSILYDALMFVLLNHCCYQLYAREYYVLIIVWGGGVVTLVDISRL